MTDYVIDQVSWHTSVQGNPESKEEIYLRFRLIAKFLEDNGLVKGKLLPDTGDIDEAFCIRTDQLTPQGREVMEAYEKWLNGIDRGKDPRDMRVLEKHYEKVRASNP